MCHEIQKPVTVAIIVLNNALSKYSFLLSRRNYFLWIDIGQEILMVEVHNTMESKSCFFCEQHLLLRVWTTPPASSVYNTSYFVCEQHLLLRLWTTPPASSVNNTSYFVCEQHLLLRLWTTPSASPVNNTFCFACEQHLLLRLWTTPPASSVNNTSCFVSEQHRGTENKAEPIEELSSSGLLLLALCLHPMQVVKIRELLKRG